MSQCTTCGGTVLVNNPLGIQEQVSDACICTNGGLVLQEQPNQIPGTGGNQACCVVSVNGKDGIVNLTTSGIPEEINLYFTTPRARQAISATIPILYNQSTGIISHNPSGVTANVYGSATQYPILTVDQWGHITNVQLGTIPNSTLDPDLVTIAALTGQGYLIRTAANTWALRSIVNSPGRTEVLNGDGVNTQTRIDLAVVPSVVPNTYGSGTVVPVITVDQYGRITNISTTPILVGGPTPHTHSLGDLSNVAAAVDTAPTGSILMFNGTEWVAGNGAGVTADNGIHLLGNIIKLGGVLTEDTLVTTEDYKLEFQSTNTGTGRVSGIKVNEANLQNGIELFTKLGTQYSNFTIINSDIIQSTGIDALNFSKIMQKPTGFIFSGTFAGANISIIELITNNSSTKQIKFPTYPSLRDDNLNPVNFLHTSTVGELISSPITKIINLTGLNPHCITTQQIWDSLTFNQQIQLILNTLATLLGCNAFEFDENEFSTEFN
jgi:hypothetical protein